MCRREAHRDGAGVDACLAAQDILRLGDIAVVGDTAVFLDCEGIVVKECLHLIAVAHIGAVQHPGEIFVALQLVGAFGIDVVEHRPHLGTAVDVTREYRPEPVLSVLFATAGVVREESHGDAGVVEALSGCGRKPRAEGVGKEKFRHRLALEKVHVHPCRTEVAGGGKGVVSHRGHSLALVVVLQSVDCALVTLAEGLGDAPRPRRLKLHLLLGLVVAIHRTRRLFPLGRGKRHTQ